MGTVRFGSKGVWIGFMAGAMAAAWAPLALAQDGEAEVGPNGGIVSHAMVMFGEPKYAPGFDHLDYAVPDAPKGGTFRQHVIGTFDSLNPFILPGATVTGAHFWNQTLMARVWDEPFTLYGLIAETVEMPEDRTWVVFNLRPEARWHDGTPITAEDVKFSIETMVTLGTPRRQQYADDIASITVLGDRSVRIDFTDKANRETPMIMGLMPMVSQAYYAEHPFEEPTLEPPLGSGPYRVGSVDAGRSISYERVEDYWAADLGLSAGHYNFDRLTFEYFRDATVAMEAFLTGAYDFRGEGDPSRWASVYTGPAVDAGEIVLEEIGNARPSGMNSFVFNTRREIFGDWRVRRALAYAFDFESLNETLFYGAYSRTTGLFDNSPLAFSGVPEGRERELLETVADQLPDGIFDEPFVVPGTEEGATLRSNLREAQMQLAEAGWTVQDNVLTNEATGTPMAFEILLVTPANETIALAFADNLARLGIEARVRTVESAQYQERLTTFDFDMIMFRWNVTLSPGNEQFLYWSTAQADQDGSRNYAGIRNTAIDALIGELANARTSEELTAAARALDRTLMWGYYFVPLYHVTFDRVAYWQGFGHPPEPSLYGNVLEAWWAEPVE